MTDQPAPTPNGNRPVWDMVIDDMRQRDAVGRERYGTPLQIHNGRDALQDAYAEALDLVVYLRQAIEEQAPVPVIECSEAIYLRYRLEHLAEGLRFNVDNPDNPNNPHYISLLLSAENTLAATSVDWEAAAAMLSKQATP